MGKALKLHFEIWGKISCEVRRCPDLGLKGLIKVGAPTFFSPYSCFPVRNMYRSPKTTSLGAKTGNFDFLITL